MRVRAQGDRDESRAARRLLCERGMPSLKLLLRSLLVAAVVVFATSRADAAMVDGFIQIAEAPGESMDARHPGWISVDSYSDTVSGGTRGFAFTMVMNRAYPKLLAATTSGQVFKLLTLELRKAGTTQFVFLNAKFENVRIANVSTSLSTSGAILPLVAVSFTCDRATWTYTPQKPDGSPDAAVVNTIDFRAAAPPAIVLPDIPRYRP